MSALRAQFDGSVGLIPEESVPSYVQPERPRAGSPNVVLVVLDDLGFADLGCYGSEIRTPSFDSLAHNGLRYTNFHTTTLCSSTRASLMTGRNHHSVGMRMLANIDSGWPSGRGKVTRRAAFFSELLRDVGYNTICCGKWHLAPVHETSAAGPYTEWPLGRGFERFYGFMDGWTDHFYPEIVVDNQVPLPPSIAADSEYHLTRDLIDHAIQYVGEQTSLTPEVPFFLYLAFGVAHSPHQPPARFLQQYEGVYDEGWDVIRELRMERQKRMGIVPHNTRLPEHGDRVAAWGSLSAENKRVYARLQQCYAGFVTHADEEFGRLVAFLKTIDQLDNTLIMLISDNGASKEGGSSGTLNCTASSNGLQTSLESALKRIDEIGSPRVHSHYPMGWAEASNTPLRLYKTFTHGGGIRDPLVVQWPAGIKDRGQIRRQFCHVVDIAPTILDIVRTPMPDLVSGVAQMPLHGASLLATMLDADAPAPRSTQYFEMFGHRGIYHDGWKAVVQHRQGAPFSEDRWELYDLASDFSETNDLSSSEPARLEEMIARWWVEAGRYDVLPLDDRIFTEIGSLPRPGSPADRKQFTYWVPMRAIPQKVAPFTRNVSYRIECVIDRASAAQDGIIVSYGDYFAGYVLFIKDNYLIHEYNYAGVRYRLNSDCEVPIGRTRFEYRFEKTGHLQGNHRLLIEDAVVADGFLPRTLPLFTSMRGMSIGMGSPLPVADDCDGEFPFAGRLERVSFELGDDWALPIPNVVTELD